MTAPIVERAWSVQSVWSQVANGLKREIDRSRMRALVLTVAGAVLSAAAVAVGLHAPAGQALVAASAVAVGLGGLVRSRLTRQAVQDWTRARSVSEAIKAEVYLYLVALGDYAGADRDARLERQVLDLEEDASDLLRFTLGLEPRPRQLPAVGDIDSYLRIRVRGQIDGFYRPRAVELQRKLTIVRRIEGALGIAGVVLAAVGGALQLNAIAVWVPVLTTVSAAITAHAAAARYEYLLVEYLRTAQELARLRDRRGSAATLSDEQLVRKAEHVISVQNEGWMAKLAGAEADAS